MSKKLNFENTNKQKRKIYQGTEHVDSGSTDVADSLEIKYSEKEKQTIDNIRNYIAHHSDKNKKRRGKGKKLGAKLTNAEKKKIQKIKTKILKKKLANKAVKKEPKDR